MAQYDINLKDYFRILRRRKGIVIFVPLLFGMFSFVLALLQAPEPLYRATAVARVERAVSVVSLLQELVALSPEANLETQAALIKGFPVMSAAAKKLGLIPQDTTIEKIRISPASLKAIRDLQEQVEVKRVLGTNLIEISATSQNPEAAVRIANSLAEAFQEDNFATRSRQVREAREFIEKQLREVGSGLRQAEDQLKAFQEANKILLLPEETKGVLSRLAALEVDYAGIRRGTGEAERQLRRLDEGKALARPSDVAVDGADPTLSKLYTVLSDLTLERGKLLLTLLPAHPQVKQLDAQIADIRHALKDTLASRVQTLRRRADELQRAIARLKREQAAIPETALEMARMEREVKVNERIFSLLKEKHQEALIKEKEQVAEVSLVRPGVGPLRPINAPQSLPKTAVGLVIGLVLGFVLAFVVEALDTSIGAIDEVESLLETPVLGVIPQLDVKAELSEETGEAVALDAETEEKYAFLISLFIPGSRVAEAFRGLRTNLLFSGLERDIKTIMVTSSTQMEGKTTVAINLAIALSQLGKRTLLVEADLRNPYLHHAFGIPKDPGLTDVLIGSARLDEAIRSYPDFILGKAGVEGLLDRRGIDNLLLLPCGRQPPNPAEFLSAQSVANFLAEARQRYDYVVVDSAPVLPVADPAILGSRVEGTLLVVRVGNVARVALRRAKALLEASRARVLGVCLTGMRAEVSPDYAEMAYYRYRYGSRERRPAPSPGWLGWLSGDLKGKLKRLALLLLLFLAVAIGIWTWRAGLLSLPFLSANPMNSVRVVRSTDSIPPDVGSKLADAAQPAGAAHEPPSEPPPRMGPSASRGDPRYTVQLHAFRSEAKARRILARYRAAGVPAFSAEAVIPGNGEWWRVFAGEFKTQDEAEVFGWNLILEGKVEKFRVVQHASAP